MIFFFAGHSQTSNNITISDGAVERFCAALRIQTISYDNDQQFDKTAFIQFRVLLEKNYPLVHQRLQRTIINGYSYIYKWQGSDSSLAPYIFMAHQDVV